MNDQQAERLIGFVELIAAELGKIGGTLGEIVKNQREKK